MICAALSNAAYRVSLHGPGAELKGSVQTHPRPGALGAFGAQQRSGAFGVEQSAAAHTAKATARNCHTFRDIHFTPCVQIQNCVPFTGWNTQADTNRQKKTSFCESQ